MMARSPTADFSRDAFMGRSNRSTIFFDSRPDLRAMIYLLKLKEKNARNIFGAMPTS